MAEDASAYFTALTKSVSSLVPDTLFFLNFSCKTELFSYLLLCVAKMPFIPPVSIARSALPGLTAKERPVDNISSTQSSKSKVVREDRSSSVKERLTLNLKQLGKKSPPRSHLPTAKGVLGAELHAKKKERLLPSLQTDSCPTPNSSEFRSKSQQHKNVSHGSMKSEPEVKTRIRDEEARFTLTLTPEAVQLLQRRNSERRQRSATRNTGSGSVAAGSDPRRRKESISKRQQPSTQRNGTLNSRVAVKNGAEGQLGDINSIVKISLLNEQHRYDDVEYEEEEDYGVDERVVLKCTEWLRGLENSPVTVGNSLRKSAGSVKSF